jgi:Predicted Fe-S oxidoreductases
MRRCNLACGYCNEYDHTSKPIDIEIVKSRLDKLADLGTSIVTISGGEPMMHPELDQIIHHIRVRGMIAGLISNGYYFTPERIKRLNKAGLEYLQISIDNVEPDEVSRKSLRVLDKKLRYLSEYADFHVNINSVIGGGIKNPDDALTVAKRATELGFSTTVGVIHDSDGTLKPLLPKEKDIFQQVKKLGNKDHARLNWFQDSIAEGKPYNWRCRAGARYLYICEDGWCTGVPSSVGIPAFLCPSTRWKTSIVSTTRRNGAHRRVRCNAFIKSASSIIGETRKRLPNKWLRNKRVEKAVGEMVRAE